MPDFLTLKEAAKHTGYNQDYIGQLVRAEKVTAKRVGKSWLVDRRSLVSYLNSLGKTPRDQELLLPAVKPIIVATPVVTPASSRLLLDPRSWSKSLALASLLFLAGSLMTIFVLAGAINLGHLYRFLPAGLRFADFTKQINYQGKIRSVSTNQAVPDDDYNLTFRLYQNLTGGSAIWTEPQTVTTRNGLFSAMLGSVTSLEGINLNQPLYLSVQVGSDSEMTPRKLLGAVPAAIVSEQLNGHFIDEFVLNNSTSTVATSSTQTIFTIDQLGSGNIFELKSSGSSKLLVNNSGSLQIGTLTGLLQGTSGLVSAIATSSLGLLTTHVTEGTNLYWKIDRFASALAGTTTDALPQGSTNLYWSSSLFNSAFSGKTTDNLTQGSTNKYYSDSLVGNYLGASSTLVSSINYWTKTGNDLSYDLGSVGIDEGNYYKYNGDNLAYASTTLYNYFYGGAGNLTMTGGNSNAFGWGALASNSSGQYNSAFGHRSLYNNTTGNYNSAFGITSLYNNISGSYNVAQGISSLLLNNTGNQNTAIGSNSLYSNISGHYNSALGYDSLFGNISGSNNSAIGSSALRSNTDGSFNAVLGSSALYYASSSHRNTAVGYGAGVGSNGSDYNSVIDSYMTFLGAEASRDNNIASTTQIIKSVAIGYNARVGGSNMMALGGTGIDAVNVGIGTSTPAYRLTVNSSNGTDNLFQIATTTNQNIFKINNDGIGRFGGDLIVSGNATTTGIQTSGWGSKIGGLTTDGLAQTNYLKVVESFFGGALSIPMIEFESNSLPIGAPGASSRVGGVLEGLWIGESDSEGNDGTNMNWGYPKIGFVGSSSDNAVIYYATTTDVLTFTNAAGYTFDNSTAVTGGIFTATDPTASDSNGYLAIGRETGAPLGWQSLSYDNSSSSFYLSDDLTINGTTTSSCFTIDGVTCLTSGGSPLPSGTDGQVLSYSGSAWVATSSIFIATSTGNVGVGTTTPSYKLTVVGDTYLDGTTNLGNLFRSNATTTNTRYFETSLLDLTGSDFGDLGYYPMLGGYSDGTFGLVTNLMTVADSISLYDTADDDLTSLNFVGNNVASIGGIEYDNQTYTFTFDEILGDANVSITGNLEVLGTGTSTFAGGIDISSGCFAVNGVCVTGGSGTSQWTTSGSDIYYDTGKVGIGTTTPLSKLHIEGGGLLVTGTTTGSTPISGAGTRMMWVPEKFAFRAGRVASSEWDDANVGFGSVAFGSDDGFGFYDGPIASGDYSFAQGVDSLASGDYSLAFGFGTVASGTNSFAFGDLSQATRDYSAAFGRSVISSEENAFGFGNFFTNNVVNSFAVGFGQKDFSVSSGTANVYGTLTVSATSTLATTTASRLTVTGTTTSSCFTVDGVTCLTGGGGTSQWTTSGSDIYYNTGKVAIGTATSSASSTLTVQGGADFAPKLTLASSIGLGDNTDSVFVLGNYAYVGSHGGTGTAADQDFIIFDISDPYNPTAVGGVDFAVSTYGTKAMFVRGKYAYMSNFNVDTYAPDEDFFVFDVSDPTNPTHVGSLNIPGLTNGPFDIDINGNYAYLVTQGTNNFVIVDISDPANMAILSTQGLNCNSLNSVKVYDDRYVYASGDLDCDGYSGNQGLVIFDVSNPTTPTLVGGYNSGGSTASYDYDFDINGRYLYLFAISSSTQEFQILDISSSTNPTYLSGRDLVASGDSRIITHDDYVFLATYASSGGDIYDLLVYNVADPENVFLVDKLNTAGSGQTYGLAMSGRYLYIADTIDNSLAIYDTGGLSAFGADISSLLTKDLTVSGSSRFTSDLLSSGNLMSLGNLYTSDIYSNEQYINLNSMTALNPLGSNAGDTNQLVFKELTANGSNYVGFKAPDVIDSNLVWTLPNVDGNINSFLTSDGAGNLSWGSSTIGSTAFLSEVSIIASHHTAEQCTNLPLAEGECLSTAVTGTRKYVNLTNYTQFRIVANQSVAGVAGSYLQIEYSLNDGSSWANLEGSSTSTDISAYLADVSYGLWGNIATSAKNDVLLRVVGGGGNGSTDPAWRQLSIQFKGHAGSQWTSEAGGLISYNEGDVSTTGTLTADKFISTGWGSQLGTSTQYFKVEELDLSGSALGDMGKYAMLAGYSDGGFNNVGAIANNLIIYHKDEDYDLALNFASHDMSSIGQIYYATTTDTFTISEVVGGSANVEITGNMGIGTSTSAYRLTVNSANDTDNLFQVATTTNQNIFTINNDGIARFGRDLTVSGDVDITGEYKINGQSILHTDLYNYYSGYLAGNAENNLASSMMNVAIGNYALSSNLEVSSSIAIGYDALRYSTSSSYNMAIGYRALKENLTGDGNLALGVEALLSNTVGDDNVALGNISLRNNTSGYNNVAISTYSLWSNQDGFNNVAIGKSSLRYNQSGIGNVAVGHNALYNNLSHYNSVLGAYALEENIGGYFNVAFGYRAGSNGTDDDKSVEDDYMVFIGTDASRDGSIVASTTPLTNGIAIGYNAKVGGSNMMALGGIGTDAVNVGIGTSTPNYALVVGSGSSTLGSKSIQVPYGGLCVDSDGECTPSLGNIAAVTYSTGNSDLAENYPVFDTDIQAGHIVSAINSDLESGFGVKKASLGSNPLGVVSTQPGITLGLDNDLGNMGQVPVALSGRVPVLINLEGGEIQAGDYITLSSVSGIGTKATSSGQTIGLSLESFNDSSPKDDSGVGRVLVFVNLGYARLDSQIASGVINEDEIWQLDEETGQIKTFASSFDLSGADLKNVRSITSASSNWSIDDGGSLIVKNIHAQNAIIESGVTVRDQGTGEYSCIYVENGAIKNKPGECQEETASITPTDPIIPDDSVGQVVDLPVPSGTSTEVLPPDDTASSSLPTSVDPIIEPSLPLEPADPVVPAPEPDSVASVDTDPSQSP